MTKMAMYFKYVIFAILSTVINIVCKFPLNLIVTLFCDNKGNLPKYLYWFQTYDASCDEGMYARRRELAADLGGQEWKSFDPDPENWFGYYINRVKWLFRNTGYGFDYFLMGLDFDPNQWTIHTYVNTPEKILFIATGPDGFNVYYHGKFGMYKLGWKAWNYWRGESWSTEPWGPFWKVPVVLSANPFKRRSAE